MAKHPSWGRRLRLRRELETIRGAVEAARILGEAMATSQLGPERDHRRAPRALTYVLALVDQRLREVRRAARRSGELRGVRTEGSGESGVGVRVRGGGAGGGSGVSRMSPDERVLAICARRQRGCGAGRRVGDRLTA